jgi:predicted nucleotidyltransferase
LGNILKTLIIKPELPVEKHLSEMLRLVDDCMLGLGKSYFIAGAQARDLILLNVFGIATSRATNDVDIGVCVEDWATFNTLKERLIATGYFLQDLKRVHRLIGTKTAIPLDLLPFGGVENPGGEIAWPPEMEQIMNVAGFSEAARSVITVQINEKLKVPVVSLPALVVLKLFAWIDRNADNTKDAIDIWIILNTYSEAGNEDRLYVDEKELSSGSGWDLKFAGVKLLGKDAANICDYETARQLIKVFDPSKRRKFKDHILSFRPLTHNNWDPGLVDKYLAAFWGHFSC